MLCRCELKVRCKCEYSGIRNDKYRVLKACLHIDGWSVKPLHNRVSLNRVKTSQNSSPSQRRFNMVAAKRVWAGFERLPDVCETLRPIQNARLNSTQLNSTENVNWKNSPTSWVELSRALWRALEEQVWSGEWRRHQIVQLFNQVLRLYQNGFDALSYTRARSRTYGVFRIRWNTFVTLWDGLVTLCHVPETVAGCWTGTAYKVPHSYWPMHITQIAPVHTFGCGKYYLIMQDNLKPSWSTSFCSSSKRTNARQKKERNMGEDLAP